MQLALVSLITVTLISSLSVFSLGRTRVFVPADSKGAPAESKGYILRCGSYLLCGCLRGCRGEEEKPELERVVVNSIWTGRSITVLCGNFRRALQRHFLVDF